MTNLKAAHDELFRRSPDECFTSLPDLMQHCQVQKAASQDLWQLPQSLVPTASDGRLTLQVGTDAQLRSASRHAYQHTTATSSQPVCVGCRMTIFARKLWSVENFPDRNTLFRATEFNQSVVKELNDES